MVDMWFDQETSGKEQQNTDHVQKCVINQKDLLSPTDIDKWLAVVDLPIENCHFP